MGEYVRSKYLHGSVSAALNYLHLIKKKGVFAGSDFNSAADDHHFLYLSASVRTTITNRRVTLI